jgi:hypothetical protein
MFMLIKSPTSGQLKEAFDVLDEVFGTGEFTEGQGVNSIQVGLEVEPGQAQTIFSTLKRNENIGEV